MVLRQEQVTQRCGLMKVSSLDMEDDRVLGMEGKEMSMWIHR